MGICARYQLQLARAVPGAPRSVVGKFAAQDATAREFMASSGYPLLPPRACVVPVSEKHLDRHMFGLG
jgi:hypothetical protein